MVSIFKRALYKQTKSRGNIRPLNVVSDNTTARQSSLINKIMKIITKSLISGGIMRWYNGNVIKKLLKQPKYKIQQNPQYIKNILTGEYLHYNKIMGKTIINQF